MESNNYNYNNQNQNYGDGYYNADGNWVVKDENGNE